MLITQKKDRIHFLGRTYKVFAAEYEYNFFDPRVHGFLVFSDNIDDAGRGYHCSFYVKYNRLILDKMYMEKKPVWWGRANRAANLFIPYTGRLIIGEEMPPQKMLDLKFSGGTFTGATDLTRKLKAIKEAADFVLKNKKGGSQEISNSDKIRTLRAIAENTFSDLYEITGACRIFWDEMHRRLLDRM